YFQIHTFNAQSVFITFLPFHESNIFGRLLSFLDLKGIEYDWVKPFAKQALPISFEKLVAKCFSANHSILSLLNQHIMQVCQLFDNITISRKLPHLFTLFSSLCIHAVSDSSNVNDGVISKILPMFAFGFKSTLIPFHLSCLMVTCQLCVTVTLAPNIVKTLFKLILLKITTGIVEESIATAVVLCQRQKLDCFPHKLVFT
ncbi:unnamed protein product, partial [Dracunculus medinensis]|uniref:HEAT repeat-containing protein 1 n=1 Tax=Dracunculus medinensis TaxID=318479 RepID=A0A0N4UD73_DRAME